MSSLGSPNPFFIAGKKAYEIERSLRFNSGDSPELTRTPSGAGNRRTWTLSFWAKISDDDLGSHGFLFSTGADASNKVQINIESSNRITFEAKSGGSTQANIRPSNNLRDVSAWYHFVIRVDTTDSTSTNRIKIYINGTQQTDLASNTFPSQNTEFEWNKAQEHNIGKRTYSSNYFNGYLAEINFIDGLSLDPSYFGKTDPITGQWNPKKYTGSYGTNGFYLNFSDNSGTTATTLGKDYSGNGNNFTPNNLAVSDAVKDSPTNNFSTLNPLDRNVWLGNINIATLSEGNLKASGADNKAFNSIGIEKHDTNKYYAEMYINSENANNYSTLIVTQFDASVFEVGYNNLGGKQINRAPSASYGATFDPGDVIGVLVDRANNQITFYKNGVSQGAISNTFSTTSPNDIAYIGAYYYGNVQTFNFGQDSTFGGAVSSGGNTDANGIGDFKYAVPTGAKALCSANLPDPTIKLPNQHFNTLLYTGNSTDNRAITGLNFQPDLTWIKRRSGGAQSHFWVDALRSNTDGSGGNGNVGALATNDTYAETNTLTDGGFESFNSDGFTLGKGSSTANADAPYQRNNASGGSYCAWNWNAGDTDGKTYTVKVVSDSGNKYRFDDFGTSAVTLDLAEGGTYIFDQSDSSNAGHPLRFSTTSNGTHGGGSEYTTGVTTAGTPGQSGAYTQIVVAASAPTLYYYCSVHSGMGGQANTNSTLGSSNFDGTIQTTVKVNATAGFSIVTYTGNGNTSATIGHGLGVAPNVIILKNRSSATDWVVMHSSSPFYDGGNYKHQPIKLSSTDGFVNILGLWATPNSSTQSISDGQTSSSNRPLSNASGDNYVAYCFSEVAGYSKFGKYTGNGNADGTFVFTGFRPAWVLIRNTVNGHNWHIYDSTRSTSNPALVTIYANRDLAEESNTSVTPFDILSNGFKIRSTWNDTNQNGSSIIYLAFAEAPFKNARAR